MSEINTDASHSDIDTPQDTEQLLEETSEVLNKNEPDTNKDVCAERNEGVSARKRKLGCGAPRASRSKGMSLKWNKKMEENPVNISLYNFKAL